ncbi:MAG: hypothetical protein V5A37_08970 [Halobacteriales archaeon]
MTEITLATDTYRRLDATSKLAGLAAVVLGLDAGIATAAGAALVAGGIAIGTATAFAHTNE